MGLATLALTRVDVDMVVVVYLDGDGDVEVDATVDATAHPCRPMHSTCSASNVSTSINEPSSSSPWSTTSSMACREAMPTARIN